ncbi:hypothetical protein INR49_030902 [Caranx melampygus]|nr:hypothetical protein INR49_030902 [Caranx melampygus]
MTPALNLSRRNTVLPQLFYDLLFFYEEQEKTQCPNHLRTEAVTEGQETAEHMDRNAEKHQGKQLRDDRQAAMLQYVIKDSMTHSQAAIEPVREKPVARAQDGCQRTMRDSQKGRFEEGGKRCMTEKPKEINKRGFATTTANLHYCTKEHQADKIGSDSRRSIGRDNQDSCPADMVGFLDQCQRVLPRFEFLLNGSSNSYDLLITNITDSDEGLYYCGTEQTKVEDDRYISSRNFYSYGNAATRITVTHGFVFCRHDDVSGSVSEVTVRPGDTITLHCDCKVSGGVFIPQVAMQEMGGQPLVVAQDELLFLIKARVRGSNGDEKLFLCISEAAKLSDSSLPQLVQTTLLHLNPAVLVIVHHLMDTPQGLKAEAICLTHACVLII